MKKRLLMLAIGAMTAAVAAENLMTGGDFVVGLKDWRYLKTGKEMVHSVENGMLKITGNEANWGKPSPVSAIHKLGTMVPGKKYMLEVAVISQVAEGKGKAASILIRSIKDVNTSIAYNGIGGVDFGNPQKRIYNVVYTVPKNAVRCELYIQTKLAPGDVLWMDDIKVTPYEPETASEENLVKNGDFSRVLLESWTGFFKEVREKYMYILPDGNGEGNNCLAVTGNKSKCVSTFVQTVPKMDPAKTYVITANINAGLTDLTGKKVELTVRSADKNNKTLSYKGFAVALGHKGWRQYRAEIKVHPDTFKNQFYISASGFVPGDMVLIDDIKLIPAE